ncbi:MAG: hypothetical protein NTV66_05395 [Methylococcales bacterium]|nr:hypothetical protein [Methylococcales bacterium]
MQQLRDGVANFFAIFIEVLEDRNGPSINVEPEVTSGDFLSGFLQGTRQALYDNNRDSITITIPQVNSKTIGSLIALFERAVGFYASLINVNAYNQPGVEAGKKAAEALLDLQRKILSILRNTNLPINLSELTEKLETTDQIEHVYKIVRHLAANNRGVYLQGNLGNPAELNIAYRH